MKQEEALRCSWCLRDALYKRYHDEEWGRPSRDDHHLFEMMVLETFQAGLSWYTVLAKRENFRRAFDGFDVRRVAAFSEERIEKLMADAGIIRNRAKIKAAVHNAGIFIGIQKEHRSFADYLWQFTGNKVIDRRPLSADIPSVSPESDMMAKDMKKRGFKFMGSTVCYAKMQSVGMVNDHIVTCFTRKKDKKA